jgi:lipoprotein-releasing system ATP-binding protein
MYNLSKVYGEGDTKVRALQDVSISVNKGEFVLIVGSSGSGKSTLLNMIGLLDNPTDGKILIDGTETTTLSDGKISEFRNHKLGFIFQFSNLLTDLTVLENVMLPRQIQGTKKTADKDARELLKIVGLEDQMHKRANKISGGQAQRAAIARGLVNHPTIVLADEPTGNLDSVSSGKIVQLMKSMAKELGQTFIVVTHDRRQFGDVDRVITIKDGWAIEGEDEMKVEITA